jgi:DNA polymerase-3 subunit delta'
MLFGQIPGQTEIKQHLISTVQSGRISHARLFFGTEGVGALPLAVAYAQYINCENKQPADSCGHCASCLKFEKLAHPDLHFVVPVATTKKVTTKPTTDDFITEWREAFIANPFLSLDDWLNKLDIENKQVAINVEESQNIIKKLSLRAYESEYKIMVVWMIEKMNAAASNKLLKILEEPPDKTLFILVCENSDSILPTIISRTQLLKIKPIEGGEMAQYLEFLHNIPAPQAKNIAFLAGGSYREAQRLLNQETDSNFPVFRQWMRDCYGNKVQNLYNWVEGFAKEGREAQKSFLIYALGVIRECIMFNHLGEDKVKLTGEELTFVKQFGPFVTNTNGPRIIAELNRACEHIERNANPKVLFLDISLTVSDLLKQVAK